MQYADYTLWQHQVLGDESDPQSAIARQLAFWTETLEELPDQLDLPSDRPRPAVSSYRGDSVPLSLSANLHAGLLALAREGRASLFMVLQAALAALLTRLGAGSDIPIGSPIAGPHGQALDELDRLLRQYLGAAHRPVRQSKLPRADRPGARDAISPPTATRTCRSSGWWRC